MRPARRLGNVLVLLVLLVGTMGGDSRARAARPSVRIPTGALHGASYRIEVPSPWNGTLLVFSHGTVTPGDANPARVATDGSISNWLTARGFALAGSAFRTTGWSVGPALPDQIALLDHFERTVGRPRHVIAWGESLGGMITAGLVQRYPHRFSGALSLCGPLAGTVAAANTLRDMLFTFKTLLAPHDQFEVVHFTNPFNDLISAELALGTAQGTARGRARIALVAAIADLPG